MPFVLADRVRETSTSTGTGNLTLAGAQPGAQRFGTRMAVGDTTWYAITGPSGTWETGVGTYVAANTLERTTPLESSGGDGRVNFAAGTKDVFMAVPAKRTVDPVALAAGLDDRYTKAQADTAFLSPAEGDAFYARLDGANAGPLGAFRNKLINTHQHINLRGYVSNTATTAANQYTIDRWRVVTSGQRLTWTMDAAGVPTYTAPTGGVEQVIEAVNIEPGTYTVSWVGTALLLVNGAGVAKGGTLALTGQENVTLRFFSGSFSLPQLERGTIATAPERRPLQVEQMLAARYAWRFDISAGAAYSVGNNGATAQTTVPLPVPGRVQGTIVPNSGTTASQTNISGAAYSVTARSVTLTITQGSGAGNYNVYVLNLLLDMEF